VLLPYLSVTYLMNSMKRTYSLYWLASMPPRNSSHEAQRDAIADEAMLQDGAVKLSALHAHEADAARVVVPISEARSRTGKVRAKSRG